MAQILFARSMLSDSDSTSDPATANTIAHLNTLFTALDVDGSGTVTAEEFHQALKPYMDESSFSKCVPFALVFTHAARNVHSIPVSCCINTGYTISSAPYCSTPVLLF
jgi:hypothetical protein